MFETNFAGENQNIYFVFSKVFLFENRAVYEKMWKNVAQPDRPQMATWRMRFAGRLTKAISTH